MTWDADPRFTGSVSVRHKTIDRRGGACYKSRYVALMREQRWLRIIPVALIMYTISYVDRTNVSLALDPKISTMMKDLLMDDRMKGEAAGIFFFGYVLLQIPGATGRPVGAPARW